MKSLKKMREERDSKHEIDLESLKKMSEERHLKHQIELEEILVKNIRLLEYTIQTGIDDRLLGFKSQLHTMEDKIKEMEKQKQSTQKGEVEENHNLRDRIKELEETLTNNFTLGNLENKLDIKPIKEEINKLIELDHEHSKISFNLIILV
jgi:TolA-binding protein